MKLTTLSQLNNTYIKVLSKEHSKEVQEAFFKFGGEWLSGKSTLIYLRIEGFVLTHSNSTIEIKGLYHKEIFFYNNSFNDVEEAVEEPLVKPTTTFKVFDVIRDLKGTYIKNDQGLLRQLYIAEAEKRGYTQTNNTSSGHLTNYLKVSSDRFKILSVVSDSGCGKELTLADFGVEQTNKPVHTIKLQTLTLKEIQSLLPEDHTLSITTTSFDVTEDYSGVVYSVKTEEELINVFKSIKLLQGYVL